MLTDYHIHSNFSLDCKSSISEIVLACREKGITSFIITDHYEVSTKDVWKDWVFNVDEYKKQMEKYSLPVGIELGWDGIAPINIDLEIFDYVLLSHHDLDEPVTKESYVKYLERLNKLIRKIDHFHCLAHLDFPRRYNKDYEPFSKDTYDLIKEILKYLIEEGKFLEVNTRSISMFGEPNPSVEILKLYRELGGEMITLGSDAHYIENIGLGIQQGLEMIKSVGFRYMMVFNNGWEAVELK
ncbi:PHP domain-containing protein [Pseudothermotoga thermarum]|uniref:Histidinol-phosphatase n=1 Tax=Pseudothermotoga thermarum DSM 5069 TaxID=688269 RepID=F7YTY5_9THEM|nr:PHP domain-containing protein [Pseudothermotoga thermarum]AEH51567.1 histidinol phosphate phosphatase HisJ family [Pseudothermotoga thermarum DSM 5069]